MADNTDKTDKRVTTTELGGSRRHDDPPPWLDKSLPLERRRKLLDQAIRDLAPGAQQAPLATMPPHAGPERRKK